MALAALACGGVSHRNGLLSAPVPLAAVAAPDEHVLLMGSSGWIRVSLATGAAEVIDAGADAVISGDTVLDVVEGRFVITRPGVRIVVADTVGTPGAVVSPDGRLAAVLTPTPTPTATTTTTATTTATATATTATATTTAAPPSSPALVVIDLADGRVQRVPLPADASPQWAWAPSSDAMLLGDEPRWRHDLASGRRTLEPATAEPRLPPPFAVDCPAHGLRLALRWHDDRHELVLTSISTRSDPDHLTSLDDRVLIAATRRADPPTGHGLTLEAITAKRPRTLSGIAFTSTCSHYVFELEGDWYVGQIATTRYAHLVRTGVP